jgi:hypothetical protein
VQYRKKKELCKGVNLKKSEKSAFLKHLWFKNAQNRPYLCF